MTDKHTLKSLIPITAAIVIGLVAGASEARAEMDVEGEFGGDCVMGLALGKDIHTDCSVNAAYKGKTYCFGNETARTVFLKRPNDFLLQAHVYYSSRDVSAEDDSDAVE